MGLIFGGISVAVLLLSFLQTPTHLNSLDFNGTDVLVKNENYTFQGSPIKVGIIHSLTGTMSISEKPVLNSTLLAIDEINQKSGILGRKIEPIIIDGQSDPLVFAEKAKYLITQEHVSAVFGGWTSASRKTMKPIFEEYGSLLFYPVQYEGLESSPNIIYTGAAPNQQVIPAIDWAVKNLGKKFFLVGSDYIFPKSANEIIKFRIHELGGEVVGEEYRNLGDTEFKEVISKIKESHPDVIINTLNGDSNISFFKDLRSAGISSKITPTISFSIGEPEIQKIGTKLVEGDYAAWNYFQSLDTPQNKQFLEAFKEKYGNEPVSDPMEAAYISVYVFANAVEKAGTDNYDAVQKSVKGITFLAPEGVVGVDPETQHLYKIVRIGKIMGDGQFLIVSSSEIPIKPIPYPDYMSKENWNTFLEKLYVGWGNKWSNS